MELCATTASIHKKKYSYVIATDVMKNMLRTAQNVLFVNTSGNTSMATMTLNFVGIVVARYVNHVPVIP